MKPRNFVAKHMRQFNKPAIMPSKRRKQRGSRVAWKDDYLALDTCFMQEEWHNKLIDELDAREDV